MSTPLSRRRLWASAFVGVALVLGAAFGGVVLIKDASRNDGTTWDSYRITRDGLVIHKTLRPCDEIVDAQVEEARARIEVTLRVEFGGICAAAAADKTTRVTLKEPVDGRAVYDGTCLHELRDDSQCIRDRGAYALSE